MGIFENLPSRKSVKKAIKAGDLKVDGKEAPTGLWIQPGMVISFEPKGKSKPVFELRLQVIFEDDFLAVVYKPAGLLTSGNKFRTLENALPFNLSKSNHQSVLLYPRPIHRLDFGTSGLLLIAKTPGSRILLGDMLMENKIDKTYHAIVHGEPQQPEGKIELKVDSKTSLTTYRLMQISRSKRYSLLELSPKTGRTHQLRIHCAESGFPIVGDKKYGLAYDPGKGMFLSATGLSFEHPQTGKTINTSTELPKKFTRLLNI